tara:strand:+ start:299 stop:460 length:162 start_codon:yes stop_codon:yes gene_type:complete
MMVVWALRPTGVINFQNFTSEFLRIATIIGFDCEKLTLMSEVNIGASTDNMAK